MKAALLLILLLTSLRAPAAEYRIDSQRAFDRLAAKTFQPGDSILFKRGIEVTGMFRPQGNGVEGQPIRIGTYGDGARPVIHAKGRHPAGLMLRDPSFWEGSGLEITNTNGTDSTSIVFRERECRTRCKEGCSASESNRFREVTTR